MSANLSVSVYYVTEVREQSALRFNVNMILVIGLLCNWCRLNYVWCRDLGGERMNCKTYLHIHAC